MRHIIISLPIIVKEASVFTTERPVTQTALTEVNMVSKKLICMVLEFGSNSIPAPIIIIAIKLDEKIRAGGKLTELTISKKREISRIDSMKPAVITKPVPRRKIHVPVSPGVNTEFDNMTSKLNIRIPILV
jgi:hypothetical protein